MHTGLCGEARRNESTKKILDLYSRIILKLILEKLDGVWIGLIWLIGTSDEVL
jgi:hypothetical protein